jgi:hypothetical protein
MTDNNPQDTFDAPTTSYPDPIEHGFSGQVVINDTDLDATFENAPKDKKVPDGSVYQAARVAWYKSGAEPGETAILSTTYTPDWLDTQDDYAVVMKSSKWLAGTINEGKYNPVYKYDITLRRTDITGEVDFDSAPLHSLSCKIQPQYDHLVQAEDHSPLPTPYGEGSKVDIQTTWVSHPQQAADRARDMLHHALPYSFDTDRVEPASRRLWKTEAHLRFLKEKESDVVHVLRQTQDLIPHRGGDMDTTGTTQDGSWLKCKISTEDWNRLGFPNIDYPILLKVYYPSDPESAPEPLNHPKIEAALAGNPNNKKPHWDEWDDIQNALKTIVCQHLTDANVSPDQLVADDILDPSKRGTHEWEHINERRQWLRDHYQSLTPEVYYQAQKPRTDLSYDILNVVASEGSTTYEELENKTGAARSTIREHVRRLEVECGGEAPGILKRTQSVQTHITLAADALRETVEDVTDEVKPDDTAEARAQRAEERRQQRAQQTPVAPSGNSSTQQPAASSGGASASSSGSFAPAGTPSGGSSTPSKVTGSSTEPDDLPGFNKATDVASATEVWDTPHALGLPLDTIRRALDSNILTESDIKVRTDKLHIDPPAAPNAAD